MNGHEELYPSYIINCVFNAYLSYATIILNSVTIHALRKTSSVPTPLKTLLLSLAVSDLGVGLLAQPLFIADLAVELDNTTRKAFFTTLDLFSSASFFGVMALSADRVLAVHLHLRYQELVTHKRAVAVVISTWLFGAFFLLLKLWNPENIGFAIFSAVAVSCLLTTTVLHYKMYAAVRRHANHIGQALQVQRTVQNGEMQNAVRMRKFAVGTFFVYLAFMFCYLPELCTSIVNAVGGISTTLANWRLYTLTLVFLNSSLNPLIYCWKMRDIRYSVIDIMRNILRC